MRVVPCVVLTACFCFVLAGCEAFNRRPAGNNFAPGGNSPPASDPAKKPDANDPITGLSAPNGASGYLAGRVINGRTGQPTKGFVRWVCLDDPKEDAAPIDVEAGPDGYFIIQGLKAGKHYKLIARTEQGDKMMAGITLKQASDMHVVIQVREDLVSATTPALPGPPGYQQKKSDKAEKKDEARLKKPAAYGAEQPASAQEPVWEAGPAVKIKVEVPGGPKLNTNIVPARVEPKWDAPNAGIPPPPPDPTRMVQPTPQQKWILDTRPKKPAVPEQPSWGPSPTQTSLNATPVPSCVLVNKQLVNFALTDTNGQPWVYKERKRGRLTLIDFWRTDCMPCLKAAPELASLQSRFGAAGLEVIGIACEQGGSPTEQGQRVYSVGKRYGMNYPLLLAGGPQCPVMRDLHVTLLPTLRLVDQNGWIVWEHSGALDEKTRQSLDQRIQLMLGAN